MLKGRCHQSEIYRLTDGHLRSGLKYLKRQHHEICRLIFFIKQLLLAF
jgi:hypothetical protein